MLNLENFPKCTLTHNSQHLKVLRPNLCRKVWHMGHALLHRPVTLHLLLGTLDLHVSSSGGVHNNCMGLKLA